MGSIHTPTDLSKDKILVILPIDPARSWIDKLEAKYPGLEVRWINLTHKGPDTPDTTPAEAWEGVTVYFGFLAVDPSRLKHVRLVQLPSAGADKWLDHEFYLTRPDVVFSTANGVHPPQIAEWVIATWLNHQHSLLRYHDHQREGLWQRLPAPVDDSVGLRMGVLGYGAIGRQCGRLAQALGMQVYAYTRSERPTPASQRDDSFCLPGTGDPEGLIPARWFHGASRADINDFLAQDLDLLVICLPLTPETDGLFGAEQFDIMARRKTFVSNIARGRLIQQDALIEALETGKIRGAALDVAEPEPLPRGHALLGAPNVYVTPHVSGFSTAYWERAMAILEANLARLHAGEPLINVVDRKLNY